MKRRRYPSSSTPDFTEIPRSTQYINSRSISSYGHLGKNDFDRWNEPVRLGSIDDFGLFSLRDEAFEDTVTLQFRDDGKRFEM